MLLLVFFFFFYYSSLPRSILVFLRGRVLRLTLWTQRCVVCVIRICGEVRLLRYIRQVHAIFLSTNSTFPIISVIISIRHHFFSFPCSFSSSYSPCLTSCSTTTTSTVNTILSYQLSPPQLHTTLPFPSGASSSSSSNTVTFSPERFIPNAAHLSLSLPSFTTPTLTNHPNHPIMS